MIVTFFFYICFVIKRCNLYIIKLTGSDILEIIKIILTSALSAAALFVITKVLGHKQMAQLAFFDYVTGITIGSIAAELATELEKPLKPLIAMVIYGLISVGLSALTNKSLGLRKFINGMPVIIMNNGKLYRENMKKAKLDLSEFLVMLRQAGFFNINDIKTAVFEYNGRLSILPKSNKRPLIPEDIKLNPQKEEIFTEIIMDGKLICKNLKKLGLDEIWLEKQLKEKNFRNYKQVYLGIVDDNNKLFLFEKS